MNRKKNSSRSKYSFLLLASSLLVTVAPMRQAYGQTAKEASVVANNQDFEVSATIDPDYFEIELDYQTNRKVDLANMPRELEAAVLVEIAVSIEAQAPIQQGDQIIIKFSSPIIWVEDGAIDLVDAQEQEMAQVVYNQNANEVVVEFTGYFQEQKDSKQIIFELWLDALKDDEALSEGSSLVLPPIVPTLPAELPEQSPAELVGSEINQSVAGSHIWTKRMNSDKSQSPATGQLNPSDNDPDSSQSLVAGQVTPGDEDPLPSLPIEPGRVSSNSGEPVQSRPIEIVQLPAKIEGPSSDQSLDPGQTSSSNEPSTPSQPLNPGQATPPPSGPINNVQPDPGNQSITDPIQPSMGQNLFNQVFAGGTYDNRYYESQNASPLLRESTYHFLAEGVNLNKTMPLLVRLHGDSGYPNLQTVYEYHSAENDPNSTLRRLNAEARKYNMPILAPLSPDKEWSDMITWYQDPAANTYYLADLIDYVINDYPNIDRNNIWFYGYSSGSEMISYGILPFRADLITGGAVMVGGGGAPYRYANPQSVEKNLVTGEKLPVDYDVPLIWVVGAEDRPQGTNPTGAFSFDALKSAKEGSYFYGNEIDGPVIHPQTGAVLPETDPNYQIYTPAPNNQQIIERNRTPFNNVELQILPEKNHYNVDPVEVFDEHIAPSLPVTNP